ncbi:MAG: hypothetical protein ACU4EQ_10550 [Candidatus Nitrosoglobus sp.]|jgi:hypothetical protein
MKTITFILLVALGTLVLQANVSADNSVTYNGSYCHPYFGNQGNNFIRAYNGIVNNTDFALYISCPVVEISVDVTTGTFSPTKLYYTGTGTVTCTLNSMNSDGSIRQSQTGNLSQTGWLSIPNITTDDFYGSYSMYCLLPPRGTLNTILLDEHDKNS